MAYGTNKKKAVTKPKPKPQPKPKSTGTTDFVNKGGSYVAFRNGRVGRFYGDLSPYRSMDTTGYAKGKKTFDLMESTSGTKPRVIKKVTRSEVPATIAEFKRGATATRIETKPKKSKR